MRSILVRVGIIAAIAGGAFLLRDFLPSNAGNLAVGDCFNSVPLPVDGSSVRISSVEALPCSQPHARQVVAHFIYQGSAWDADLEARSTRDCGRRLDDRYQMSWIRSVPRRTPSPRGRTR